MADNTLAEHMTCIQTLHAFFLFREGRTFHPTGKRRATAASDNQSRLSPINPAFMSSVHRLIIQSAKCQKKVKYGHHSFQKPLLESSHSFFEHFQQLAPLCCSHFGVLLNLNCSFCSTSSPKKKPRRYFICSDSLLKKSG